MSVGWIKTHRSKLKWEWFNDPKTSHLFEYILLCASHNDYKWRGQNIKKGCLPFGLQKASFETGISIQSIRTCLQRLESTNEITIKTSNKGSLIQVVKWCEYQISTDESTSSSTSSSTNDQQTTNKQLTTTKNYNNYKNEKKVKKPISILDDAVKLWNNNAPNKNMPKINTLGDKRKTRFKKAEKEFPNIEDWRKIFSVASTKFFTDKDGSEFIPNWDYIFRNSNYISFYEEYDLLFESKKSKETKTSEVISLMTKG